MFTYLDFILSKYHLLLPLERVPIILGYNQVSRSLLWQLSEGCMAHWRRYENSVAELTNFNTTNSSWDWTSASPYSCDKDNGDYKYSWCESGRYIPPQVQYKSMVWLAGLLLFWWIQCENNPDCVDVLMNR